MRQHYLSPLVIPVSSGIPSHTESPALLAALLNRHLFVHLWMVGTRTRRADYVAIQRVVDGAVGFLLSSAERER